MVLVISFHVDVQNQCNALILAIFIIDWPTIWIRITWVNRIHFISISCVFDVFRSFCKILHNLQTKSNAVAFNWSGVFCSNVGKSVVLIWIFADRCRQWMGQYRFFLSFEWNADITHYILKSNILLLFLFCSSVKDAHQIHCQLMLLRFGLLSVLMVAFAWLCSFLFIFLLS